MTKGVKVERRRHRVEPQVTQSHSGHMPTLVTSYLSFHGGAVSSERLSACKQPTPWSCSAPQDAWRGCLHTWNDQQIWFCSVNITNHNLLDKHQEDKDHSLTGSTESLSSSPY